MPHKSIKTEIRCELSRRFPIAQGDVDLYRYKLKPLPSKYSGQQEAILIFEDDMKKGHSNAEHEGEIVLSFMSLLFDCHVQKTGYRVNGLDISGEHPSKAHLSGLFEGSIVPGDSAAMVRHLFTLGDQLTKQFVRACNAYALAIASVELDRSLSFLLLVTALECLSTQEEFCPNAELDKSKKSTERYCRLVSEYCSDVQKLYPNDCEVAFLRDLKTVYYSHRSGFVHGGKEVSIASEIADRANSNNIGHFVEGKEVFTPGLKWFFQITRGTLIGFLLNFPRSNGSPNQEVLADIARSRAVLTIRVGEPNPDEPPPAPTS
jgi:hypothetical protein